MGIAACSMMKTLNLPACMSHEDLYVLSEAECSGENGNFIRTEKGNFQTTQARI